MIKKYPLILVSILFIMGIISSSFVKPEIEVLFFYLVVLAFIIFYYLFARKKPYAVISIYLYAGFFLSGNFYNSPVPDPGFKKVLHKEEIILAGTISDIGLGTINKLHLKVESDSIINGKRTYCFNGNFYCAINNDSNFVVDISPGNKIMLTGRFMHGRERRNPGETDYEDYLHKSGITGYVYSSIENFTITDGSKNALRDFIYRCRKYLAGEINKYHDTRTASLLKGLILGDKSEIDSDIRNDFINTGTAHILAVSGLHVGYIILIFVLITGRMNLYLRTIFTAAGIILFIFISGASPSVMRASLMTLTVLIAFVTNRSANIFNSLALSALILLIIDPSQIFLPGFQLSFAAVISIAAIYPVFKKYLDGMNFKYHAVKKTILFMSVSLAAQIGTLPFVLFYFSKLSLVSLISNLFVIPAAGFIVGTAFITLILSPLVPFLAEIFAGSNILLCSLLFEIIKITGNDSFSFLWIFDFSIMDGVIFCLSLILLFTLFNNTKPVFKIIFVTLILTNIFIYTSFDNFHLPGKEYLSCYMIDVGQGDAILLKFPSGKTALIDAGETNMDIDTGEKIIEPLLKYFGINKIDYAFVSHLDVDHYSGFVHLIKNGYVKYLYKPGPDTSLQSIRFEKFLSKCNVDYEYYREGILNIDNARIYFLDNTGTGSKPASNDMSGVFHILYGNTGMLFTGDAGIRAEKWYIEKYGDFLRTNVLKVSHHGSATATSDEFLFYTKPEISLISAGEKNKFGHPSGKTLDKLNNIYSRIYRTDKEGGILLRSDGYKVVKINWKK